MRVLKSMDDRHPALSKPGQALKLLPLGVAALLVLLGLAVPLPSYERAMLLLTAGAGAVAVWLILYQYPLWGLALIPLALLVPFRLPTGTGTGLNPSFLLPPVLLTNWLLSLTLGRRSFAGPSVRPFLPAALLMTAAVIATLVGQYPWFPSAPAPLRAQLVGLALFLFSGGLYFLAADQLRSLVWLKRITWIFLAAGAVILAPRLSDALPQFPVAPGAIGSLFWTWLVALALGQAVFNRDLKPRFRAALFCLGAAALAQGVFLGGAWLSGWFPGVIAIIAMALAAAPLRAMAGLLAGGLLATLTADRLAAVLLSGDQSYSLMTRIEAARVLQVVVSANPLIGLGPANYYHYTPLFPILGWYVNFNSHNNYIDLLAQTGIVGLLCFVWFAWASGRMALELRKRRLDGFARGYTYGAIGGLAGTLAAGFLGDWVIPFVYNVGVEGFRSSCLAWLFLGGLAALDWNTRKA